MWVCRLSSGLLTGQPAELAILAQRRSPSPLVPAPPRPPGTLTRRTTSVVDMAPGVARPLLPPLLGIGTFHFQIIHSSAEEGADAGPANSQNKDQDRDRNRPNNQDRLQADRSLFITVNTQQ